MAVGMQGEEEVVVGPGAQPAAAVGLGAAALKPPVVRLMAVVFLVAAGPHSLVVWQPAAAVAVLAVPKRLVVRQRAAGLLAAAVPKRLVVRQRAAAGGGGGGPKRLVVPQTAVASPVVVAAAGAGAPQEAAGLPGRGSNRGRRRGRKSTGFTHPERSKIMNSRAFSCAESAVRVEQQPGNAFPALVDGSPWKSVDAESLTCRAV